MQILSIRRLYLMDFFFHIMRIFYRFTIYKVHKASKKKREKSSAKKERKATKTLAIVLGKFDSCIKLL